MPMTPQMKSELDQYLTGSWKVEMMKSPCEQPATWCYGFCCPCCFAYQQREQLLELTHEPYVCCGGMFSCCGCNKPCDNRNPWLCLETCCCTNSAILANRFMLQTRFDIKNDPCDNTLISIIAVLNCLSLIVRIFGDKDSADCCEQLTECVNAIVCACMLTQHDIQIKEIESGAQPYAGVPQQIMQALPPCQQQMINGFAELQPTAPGYSPPQYGAAQAPIQAAPVQAAPVMAAPRQMMVVCPPGTAPGQMIQFTTPEGNTLQVVVPAGVDPGQQFAVPY